jgi:hypothetical protein
LALPMADLAPTTPRKPSVVAESQGAQRATPSDEQVVRITPCPEPAVPSFPVSLNPTCEL